MSKLDDSIKAFNAVYTDTLERDTYRRTGFDLDESEINYENSISLYDLVYAFNKMQLSFKKEYDELDKFDLGKEVYVERFNKTEHNGDIYRLLEYTIFNPKIKGLEKERHTFLYLREINGVSKPFATNDASSFISDRGYYRIDVRLDAKKVKAYLNLFEKYDLLFELYRYIKKQMIFGDGDFYLVTQINDGDSGFVDEMKSFKIILGAIEFNKPSTTITLTINLGDKLSFDLNNCEINLNGETIKTNNELCLDILKRIHVSGHYLEKEQKPKKEYTTPKVKMLINNIQ